MSPQNMPTIPRTISQRSITKLKSLRYRMLNRKTLYSTAATAVLLYIVFFMLNQDVISDSSAGGLVGYLSSQTSAITKENFVESVISSDILNEASEQLSNLLSSTPTTEQDKEEEVVASFQDYVDTKDAGDLRTRLSIKFPYDRHSEIPNYIWQTWSTGLEQVQNDKLKKCITSWAHQEGYKHFLITDDEIEDIINDFYGKDFPEILETYRLLPLEILKFDFFRYLMLYAKGGIYTDIDTLNIVETSKWLDSDDLINTHFGSNVTKSDIGLMIGIEGDYDKLDWKYKMARRLQFVQWTLKAKKGHPILREVINSIVKTTLNNYNQRLNHVKIGDEYFTLLSIYTVLEWTGPALFTDSVFDHFNKIYDQVKPLDKDIGLNFIDENNQPSIKYFEFGEKESIKFKDKNQFDQETKKFMGWNNFTKIMKPVLYDDVVVLPINSFNGFIDDLEYPVDNKLTYIKHEFHGTWKNMKLYH